MSLRMCLDADRNALYFAFDEGYFPEEGWVDLIDADFEHWIPELTSFLIGNTDSCYLYFMDGPYGVRFMNDQGTIKARFLENGQKSMPQCAVDLGTLAKSVLQCLHRYHRTQSKMSAAPKFAREQALIKDYISRQGENHV